MFLITTCDDAEGTIFIACQFNATLGNMQFLVWNNGPAVQQGSACVRQNDIAMRRAQEYLNPQFLEWIPRGSSNGYRNESPMGPENGSRNGTKK